MKIQTRIMVLLGATISVFVLALIWNQIIKKRQLEIFMEANKQAKVKVIENILSFKADNIAAPANDYSCWDEMVTYAAKPTKKWEDVNLTTILDAYGSSQVWIFNKNLKLVYTNIDSTVLSGGVELSADLIKKLFSDTAFCHFFLPVNDTLFEVAGATIVPSTDNEHKTQAQGYLLTAKFWSKDYIRTMEQEMDFQIHIQKVSDVLNNGSPDENKIVIAKDYLDPDGNKIITVLFESRNQLMQDLSSTNFASYIIAGLLILTVVIFFFAIRAWVSVPLHQITEGLNKENIEHLNKLETKKNEFGEIAKLIKLFFDQKVQLEIEIAERIETQKTVDNLYHETVNLNHELQASEEELRQNLDITMELNEALQKQQSDINDSLNYASRIQAALLPPAEMIESIERNYFLLFKPRSIVSGDFYWMARKNNKTFFAVADCTGHGVPGGFMSMLGMALLSEIVNQLEHPSPGEILDNLRLRVIESLHQTGKRGESKDGMDIAIFAIDFNTMKIEFAGAFNPLYIVRKSENPEGNQTQPRELIEFKGDRMPIGYHLVTDKIFTNFEFNLQQDDVLYILTDGYQDQLNPVTQQKFRRAKLKELFVEIADRSMGEQKEILELAFDAYKGDYPQIDDVLIFGLKV